MKFTLTTENVESSQQKIRKINQAKIVQSAELEFKKYGFNGASIARIAKESGIPRSNIHYYYKSKLALYGAVLSNIINLWNRAFADIKPSDDPKEAISKYIDAKIEYSRTNPTASIIFASELLHGAPHLSSYLNSDFKEWIKEKANVIQQWKALGKIDNICAYHLLFTIWGATQHYANFSVEIEAALDRPLTQSDFEDAKQTIKHIILKGCGLYDN